MITKGTVSRGPIMGVPQEVLGEIINHLPTTVQATSARISRTWTYPANHSAYRAVDLLDEEALKRWLEARRRPEHYVHVRSLSCAVGSFPRNTDHEENVKTFINIDLPFFQNLHYLSLHSGYIESNLLVPSFAFQSSLHTLTLDGCKVSISQLVILLNKFPVLVELDLHWIRDSVSYRYPPVLSHTPKKLSIKDHGLGWDVLDELSNLEPRFEEITLDMDSKRSAQDIVNRSGGSLKRLNLKDTLDKLDGSLVLSRCGKLREVEMDMVSRESRDGMGLQLISTITSRKLQKIKLNKAPVRGREKNGKYWESLDGVLVEMAKKGMQFTVEVHLPDPPNDRDPSPENFLPNFQSRDKCRVKVVGSSMEGRRRCTV